MIQNKIRQGQNWYKYAIIWHLIGLIGPYKAWKFMHTDHRVTHTPWKVDRNLQWMSHHPTNPTYICMLSWAMTQNKCLALDNNTRQHKTNTCIQKMWFLPVRHNLHQGPTFIKNAVMDQWCKPEGKNHYSGHIPIIAVNALIIDQLSHWNGYIGHSLLVHSLMSFPQQGVYTKFEFWIPSSALF